MVYESRYRGIFLSWLCVALGTTCVLLCNVSMGTWDHTKMKLSQSYNIERWKFYRCLLNLKIDQKSFDKKELYYMTMTAVRENNWILPRSLQVVHRKNEINCVVERLLYRRKDYQIRKPGAVLLDRFYPYITSKNYYSFNKEGSLFVIYVRGEANRIVGLKGLNKNQLYLFATKPIRMVKLLGSFPLDFDFQCVVMNDEGTEIYLRSKKDNIKYFVERSLKEVIFKKRMKNFNDLEFEFSE